MNYNDIIKIIKLNYNEHNVEGMARYGINPRNNFGVSIGKIRELAKEIGIEHDLAIKLWDSDIHDARLLAPLIADPEKMSDDILEKWVNQIDSWDICDNLCGTLLQKIPGPYEKAGEWCNRDEEFVKRTGFVLVARLAVKDKKADDSRFEYFFPLIVEHSGDDRNMVKKGVNWALRQIGKRNLALNKKAIKIAEKILEQDTKSARWIARDALRELRSEKTMKRLAGK